MMFNDSSERACSVSIGEYLRDAGISGLTLNSDLLPDLSHLVIGDGDGLPRAEPRRQLDLVAHPLRRTLQQQMALVVVAHLEHLGRRLLAFHVSLAQLQIDSDLHLCISLRANC